MCLGLNYKLSLGQSQKKLYRNLVKMKLQYEGFEIPVSFTLV